MKKILENSVTAKNNNFKVFLGYTGEGYNGDYDRNDPDDEPLLRIDIYQKAEDDRRRWCDDAVYSSCTGISARVTEEEALAMCDKVLEKLDKLPPEKRCEPFFMMAWESALKGADYGEMI